MVGYMWKVKANVKLGLLFTEVWCSQALWSCLPGHSYRQSLSHMLPRQLDAEASMLANQRLNRSNAVSRVPGSGPSYRMRTRFHIADFSRHYPNLSFRSAEDSCAAGHKL